MNGVTENYRREKNTISSLEHNGNADIMFSDDYGTLDQILESKGINNNKKLKKNLANEN